MRKKSWLSFATSALRSHSSAAARKEAAFVFPYWKQPVSVERAIYRRSDSSLVTEPQSSLMTFRIISPQADAEASSSRLFAKRELDS